MILNYICEVPFTIKVTHIYKGLGDEDTNILGGPLLCLPYCKMTYPRNKTYRLCVMFSHWNQWSFLYKLIVKPVINSPCPHPQSFPSALSTALLNRVKDLQGKFEHERQGARTKWRKELRGKTPCRVLKEEAKQQKIVTSNVRVKTIFNLGSNHQSKSETR